MKNESFIDPSLSHYINVRKRNKLINMRRLNHAEMLFSKLTVRDAITWKACLDIAWREIS